MTEASVLTKAAILKLKSKNDAPKRMVSRPFPIPKIREEKFLSELHQLCDLGVLRKLKGQEAQGDYAFPAFTVPKKDGINIRFVSDFRKLNEWVERAPFLIPPARDILNKMEGFSFATTMDLNMGYWHI